MADKKMVEAITSMDVDFAQWYTDVVKKAELIDYTSVKGMFILRPYGYAIWENIQRILDGMFKATGHENVNMPRFIPESLLQKEPAKEDAEHRFHTHDDGGNGGVGALLAENLEGVAHTAGQNAGVEQRDPCIQ